HVPEGAERHYREKVLRLPDGYLCYDPPAYAPDVGPLPARGNGRITFGCFNNVSKINTAVVKLWSEVLRQLPTARLLLQSSGWDDGPTAERFRGAFAENEIDPARLDFHGWSPHPELLARYGAIDVALDPFPYSGGLTTCEALWMGVPVVTWPQA